MLRIEGLSASYGRVRALHDVSLECGEGALVAIVGPNGAGKSTLLNSVAGGLDGGSARGSVELDGTSILGRAPEAIVRLGLSLVPEGRRILGSLSVSENLALALGKRASKDVLFEPVAGLVPELREHADKQASLLSGGQQQQLAIARALLVRPRILLMDEPSLGLAPKVINEVFAAIERLRAQGIGIVLVEQHARRAVAVADRTYVLHKGRVAAVGEKEDLGKLEAAYWGETLESAR